MPEQVHISIAASVVLGPSLSAKTEIAVSAYDKLSREIAFGSEAEIPLLPDGSEPVLLLIVPSGEDLSKLTCEFDASGDTHRLDAPQLFLKGGIDHVGAVQKVKIKNDSADENASVEILAARASVP